MSETRFTLSWESFQQNICNGLGVLQQNEDLVDMTLAADGHLVRVHKLVLSLASPYFSDLIKSAQCQNPVIFLNRISSKVLSSILEYIYTGQVVVAKEDIEELVQAAKALHIKGLMDMSYQVSLSDLSKPTGPTSSLQTTNVHQDKISILSVKDKSSLQSTKGPQIKYEIRTNHLDDSMDCTDHSMDETFDDATDTQDKSTSKTISNPIWEVAQKPDKAKIPNPDSLQLQFSVSNQGKLQLVLNRFVYFLRYVDKNGHRRWQCTDYTKKKCPALVITKDDVVVKRISAHIHPFHDRKIAKRIRANSIFSVISEAEKQSDERMKEKEKD